MALPMGFSCLLFALAVQVLFLCAKHLFVAAMGFTGACEVGKSEHDGGAGRVRSRLVSGR